MPGTLEGEALAVRARRSAAALLALLAAAACTSLQTKIEPPVVTLDSVRILSVADAKANIELGLRLTNPNRFDLAVEAIEYEITLDGRPAASGRTSRIDLLPAGGEGRVDLAGRVDVTAVATALMALGSQLPVEYVLKGAARLRNGTAFDLSRKGKITVARFDRVLSPRP
jgi:LEA14-like dessication related protein